MVKSRLPCFIVRQHALASAQHDHDMAVLLVLHDVVLCLNECTYTFKLFSAPGKVVIMSDVCLSDVCLSRTWGVTREQVPIHCVHEKSNPLDNVR